MIRGQLLIALYEVGRDVGLDHNAALDLAARAIDVEEDDILRYSAYFELREIGYNKETCDDLSQQYQDRITKLLDEQG